MFNKNLFTDFIYHERLQRYFKCTELQIKIYKTFNASHQKIFKKKWVKGLFLSALCDEMKNRIFARRSGFAFHSP